jgi:hypothetical protein
MTPFQIRIGFTQRAKREGYRTVRVTNADVMQNLEGVLTQISFSLREKDFGKAQHVGEEGSKRRLMTPFQIRIGFTQRAKQTDYDECLACQ